MSESKAKELFYSLDVFPANPSWRINNQHHFSTWKSVLCTVIIFFGSLGLSYDSIHMLFIDAAELSATQMYEWQDTRPPTPFLVGIKLKTQEDEAYMNITVGLVDNTTVGKVERQQSCPSELIDPESWSVCYLITTDEMFTTDYYIVILTNTTNPYTVYLEKFSISYFVGSTPRQYQILQCGPGFIFMCQLSKDLLTYSGSILEKDSTQHFIGIDYQNCTTFPVQSPTGGLLTQFVLNTVKSKAYHVRRDNVFDVLGVFLGWFQLFTMCACIVFLVINSLNSKLQICKALFSNAEILESKVSFLFYIKFTFLSLVYFFGWKRCLQSLRAQKYLRKEFICYAAFKKLEDEMSVESIGRSIAVLKNNLREQSNSTVSTTPSDHDFDYRFESNCGEQNEDTNSNSRLYNILSVQRYAACKVNKRPHKHEKRWFHIIKNFDVSASIIEYTLNRSQKSSVLSIVITYSWIAATILLVCFFGILSIQTPPVALYRATSDNYTYYLDFSRQPFYLRQIAESSNYTVKEFNASIVDSEYRFLQKLQTTKGEDCPPLPSLFKDKRKTYYCVSGKAPMQYNKGPSASLMIAITYNDHALAGTQLEMYDYSINGTEFIPTAQFYVTFGAGDQCAIYETTATYSNGAPFGLLARENPNQFGGDICLNGFNGTDQIYTTVFVYRIGSELIYREELKVGFFNSVNEGWNIALIFVAVLVYLVTRPYNKRTALRSVVAKTNLRQFEKVEVLLDISNVLLYLRAKESMMGADRYFFKSQIKAP